MAIIFAGLFVGFEVEVGSCFIMRIMLFSELGDFEFRRVLSVLCCLFRSLSVLLSVALVRIMVHSMLCCCVG